MDGKLYMLFKFCHQDARVSHLTFIFGQVNPCSSTTSATTDTTISTTTATSIITFNATDDNITAISTVDQWYSDQWGRKYTLYTMDTILYYIYSIYIIIYYAEHKEQIA